MFYAGVLAFSDGIFALKMPAIASSQRRSLPGAADPPLFIVSVVSWLHRWIYCILASMALANQDIAENGQNFALIGVSIYLLVRYIPEIVAD